MRACGLLHRWRSVVNKAYNHSAEAYPYLLTGQMEVVDMESHKALMVSV